MIPRNALRLGICAKPVAMETKHSARKIKLKYIKEFEKQVEMEKNSSNK